MENIESLFRATTPSKKEHSYQLYSKLGSIQRRILRTIKIERTHFQTENIEPRTEHAFALMALLFRKGFRLTPQYTVFKKRN